MTEAGKKKQRAAAKVALVAQLDAALAEAREAARTAAEAHLRRYPRIDGEHYEFGGAVLLVRKPSPAFREALKVLTPTDRWHDGGGPVSWRIKTGYRTPRGIGGTGELQEIAERAAQAAMTSRFPGEEFWVHTWVD
jgi:hypothetical protein